MAGICSIDQIRWVIHEESSTTNVHLHVSGNCTGLGSGEMETEVVSIYETLLKTIKR